MHRRHIPVGDRRFALTVACLLSILVIAPVVTQAAPPDVPRPLRSKDLGNWMKEIAPSESDRMKCEQAFDAYVDQWEQLRDQSVRPAQSKHEAAGGGDAAEAAWRGAVSHAYESMSQIERSMFDAMKAAKLSEDQRAKLDRFAAARARKRAGTVVRGVPVNLPKMPAIADLSADKQAEIDRRLREWEMSATPLIERLASASLDDKGADREQDLRRKVLASERAAVKDIAALLPPDEAKNYSAAFRRQALPGGQVWSDFATGTPASLRSRLDADAHKEALARIDEWQKQREAIEEAALDALASDKSQPEAIAELASKYAEMNKSSIADIAQAANMPDLADSNQGMMITFNGLDGDGSIDLSDLQDLIPGDANGMSGTTNVMAFSTADISAGHDMGDGSPAVQSMFVVRGDGAGGNMGEGGSVRSMKVQMVIDDSSLPGSTAIRRDSTAPDAISESTIAAGGAPRENLNHNAANAGGRSSTEVVNGPDENSTGFRDGMLQLRPLSRQDIELLHARLAVPEAQRAVWDSMAGDLLAGNSEWLKGAPASGFPILVGEDLAAFQGKQKERAEALVGLEDAWFENMKSGIQGIDAAMVDRERGRRALERERALVNGSTLPMPELMMSRWGRVDLYKAAEALPAEARDRAMPAIDAWCRQMQQELSPFPDKIAAFNIAQRAFMNIMTSDDGAGRVQMSMNVDPKGAAEIDKLRKPIMDAWRHVEQTQAAAVDAVSATLAEPDAKLLRRAVRQQTHPEVFKTQDRVNGAVERAMALPSMTPAQAQAVNALMDDYRQRCDALIEKSIEHTDKSDAGIARMMQGASSSAKPGEMERDARAMQVTERMRGDASYDREELNARALRRLRAALTEDQARAAKLN